MEPRTPTRSSGGQLTDNHKSKDCS
jgi:hypothetical protein